MVADLTILLGKGKNEDRLLAHMANRHGMIAGATGTGKTVTLRVLAEGFSRMGVPVFMADVKGDLAGLSQMGAANPKVDDRLKQLGITDHSYAAYPVTFWDTFGVLGHPVRTTVSEMGPLLLSRLFNLNDTQSGVLSIVFKAADENGMLLLDLKDLQAMLQYVGEHAKEMSTKYGNVSAASVGAIQRALLMFHEQGGDNLFGEPALNVDDLMQTDAKGRGVINILAADKLMESPRVYATLLMWLLSELYERLPEVGDVEKPKLVFFFDEAHLLFDDAPDVLLEKIQQVVRLIRSKGVGVYFVSQSPLDIPDTVLGQLGNRVQHALRAFTAKDQKAIKAVSENFRCDDSFDVASALTELAIGEALVSLLDGQGSPTVVERALILPPQSRMGAITDPERKMVMQSSLVSGVYEKVVDRESAYEKLKKKHEANEEVVTEESSEASPAKSTRKGNRATPVEAFVTSTVRSIGSQLGRQILRGIMGSIFGNKRS